MSLCIAQCANKQKEQIQFPVALIHHPPTEYMIDSPSVMIDEGSVKTPIVCKQNLFNEYSASSKQSSSARREMSKHFSRDVSKILEIFCLYLKDVGNLLFSFKDPGNL